MLLLTKAGFTVPDETPSEQIQSALTTSSSVLVVVAHSDGNQIYLPDGTTFNPASLSPEAISAISKQRPLIIFLSCDTATPINGSPSLAQRLLDLGQPDLGPRMVIAPNGKLTAEFANRLLQEFFQNLQSDPDALKSFRQALRSVYPDGLIPGNDDGLDHFFQFLTQENPFQQEERL